MILNNRRTINGWAFYDWANSAYYLVISTAVFPIYYLSIAPPNISILGSNLTNTSLYSYAVSTAYILIAFLTPILSGIADYSGKRMLFLRIFTWIGALGCVGLFFFSSPQTLWIGTFAFMLGTIGAAGGLVFYDSYLPVIATEDQFDKVSARGYAFGYFGSVLLLIVCLILIQKPEWFGISHPTLPSRIGFVLVAIWWIGFSQITFKRLPKDEQVTTKNKLLAHGWHELGKVWHEIKQDTHVKRFLSAYFFYIAGVHTVIYLATIFADSILQFETFELILTILILQLVAIPGAYFFAWVSSAIGNKWGLLIQLIIWALICLGAFSIVAKWQFFCLAGVVGFVLGGIQSLSRSSYAKLLEDRTDDRTSFFSFMDILSKIAIVSGTFIFGTVNLITGNIRHSVLALMVFFVLGIVLLSFVAKSRLNTLSN